MPKNKPTWIWYLALVVVCAIAWVTLVPSVLLPTAFGWIAGTALLLLVVILRIVGQSGPVRSMSQVLYDVEHPANVKR